MNRSRAVIGASLALNLILWFLAAFAFPQDTPAAILHYNSSFGIDFIGRGSQIYVLPFIGSLLLVGNVALSFFLLKSSKRAAVILISSLPIIQILLLVSFALLWRLNSI